MWEDARLRHASGNPQLEPTAPNSGRWDRIEREASADTVNEQTVQASSEWL